MSSEVKVSVCVVTYNQEKYIAECLQSLVDQVTDFPFEIIVGEDCSTDRTREIVLEFQKKYQDIVKPLLHTENVGANQNYLMTHAKACGKYIAHMDGDDYALPGKLQAQVDFLDENPECNMVFHRMNFIDGEEYVLSAEISNRILAYKFYRSDIIEFVAIGANSSKMYRKELREIKLPDFNLVDYTVNVVQVDSGYAAYCSDKALGVYRRGIGISGSLAVNNAVFNSLNYFIKIYPECKLQINTSAWAWFLSNIKNNKRTKWLFLKIIFQTGVILGLYRYIASRGFRKELSGL
ncbi:MAG TPA: glycosyltransferase [Pseudomonas sp.]|uniref:glycosyltransferase family 2 protein n=1 Tax=Pseudomonas sp. TaxID=306 RepID=UPI002C005638|nr:glycosyltransferase [Pseudomonas sp.]HRL93833.1 glycosyltransferase [Pseudomonas sp.]